MKRMRRLVCATLDVNSISNPLPSPTPNSPTVDRRKDTEKTSTQMDANQTKREERIAFREDIDIDSGKRNSPTGQGAAEAGKIKYTNIWMPIRQSEEIIARTDRTKRGNWTEGLKRGQK